MTKVYLVYMSGWTKQNNYREDVWAVFTNKRKAQVYRDYKIETTDEKWLNRFQMKEVTWIIRTERIWNEDFTDNLNRIKTEKLLF